MTNEELERVMNFIIERQEQFGIGIQQLRESDVELRRLLVEQMVQSDERMTRLEEAMAQSDERMTRIEGTTAQQQAGNQNMQAAIFALIESQQHTNADVRNLSTVVDRITEAVAVLLDRTDDANGNGNKGQA